MVTNQQITFLQEKIQEIGSAIFFNLSDSVLKLPTSIVSTLQVDDFGYIWVYMKKPKQNLQEFESEFPARLDFYRKGTGSFLQVEGKAWVVDDPEEMNLISILNDQYTVLPQDTVLVKIKIIKADYFETKTAHQNSWWHNVVQSVSAWFGNSNQYRPGNTYIPAS